jgi:hypothetical protein
MAGMVAMVGMAGMVAAVAQDTAAMARLQMLTAGSPRRQPSRQRPISTELQERQPP